MKNIKNWLFLPLFLGQLSVQAIAAGTTTERSKEEEEVRDIKTFYNLSEALEKRDEAAVQRLLKAGAKVDSKSVNLRDSFGRTPLMRAAAEGNPLFVGALLTGKPKIRALDDSGESALMKAAGSASTRGHRAIIQILLKESSNMQNDLQEANGFDETALLKAAIAGHSGAVRLLLENGATFRPGDLARVMESVKNQNGKYFIPKDHPRRALVKAIVDWSKEKKKILSDADIALLAQADLLNPSDYRKDFE